VKDAQARRKRAVEAALDVARILGLDVTDARVLRDANNTIIHLVPVGLVAKVGTTTLRPDAHETLWQELRIALHLAERGAPIGSPSREVPPGPHAHDDAAVTLWQYIEPEPVDVTDAELGRMLRDFHEAFSDYSAPLPDFRENLQRARAALKDEGCTPLLADDDRSFLSAVAAILADELAGGEIALHPLHGDPHPDGNVLVTKDGPLLVDFEAACLGPYEWDLTALRQASDAYPSIDRDLMALLSRMRSLTVSTWCWMQYGRAPEVDEAAHVHLQLLRENASAKGSTLRCDHDRQRQRRSSRG
jgi:hypothetical protein